MVKRALRAAVRSAPAEVSRTVYVAAWAGGLPLRARGDVQRLQDHGRNLTTAW
ncbi:hypothetical protein RB200_23055 [Streptomyces sp. PmtG]